MAVKTTIKLDKGLGRRLKIEAAKRGVTMVALAERWIEGAHRPPTAANGVPKKAPKKAPAVKD